MCFPSKTVICPKGNDDKVRLICLPWAGGSSLLFSSWQKRQRDGDLRGIEVDALDYPGRMSKLNEPRINKLQELVDSFSLEDDGRPTVIFGHSFGAIVAFELALRLQAKGKLPLAVFCSASVPPHKPLVTQKVSTMNIHEICDYFANKGNPVSPTILQNTDLKDMFLNNIKADYRCLETYTVSQATLQCPLFVFGGGLDPGVSRNDIDDWVKHVEPQGFFERHVFEDQGHFYLNDPTTMENMGNIITARIQSLLEREEEGEERVLFETIAQVFATTLELEASTIQLHSNFFDLGGTSLDTMMLTAQLQQVLDIHVTQNEFIMHPTVKLLAKRIATLKKQSTHTPKLVSVSNQEGKWFPASAQQEQMVSCWETAPAMYNMPTTIEFHGKLDVVLLRKAYLEVVRRQPSLRTIVHIDDSNKIFQKCLADPQVCFLLEEIPAQNENDAQAIIERESLFIFDLTRPPISRGVLVKKSPTSHLLLLNQHHVGSDGWSRTQFRRQLLQHYLILREGKDLPPPTQTIYQPTYIDWSVWSRKWLHDCGQFKKQISYWTQKLKDLPTLDLPLDHPRPAVLTSRGARIAVQIEKESVQDFAQLMNMQNANMFVGLLSLYMTLLNRWGAGDDFAIGIALANRHHEGLENRIGYHANEVAIRAEFEGDPCYQDVLCSVRTNVLEAMANADCPFHEVTEALKVVRDRSRTSVFQAMFALQEREWHSIDDLSPDDDLKFNLKQYNHNTSKFEVHLQLRHDGNGGLEGDFHIATDLFTVETGKRMVEGFKQLMQQCVAGFQAPLSSHNITPTVDTQLQQYVNQTDVEYSSVGLLERIASAPRDLAAIVTQLDGAKTYGELNDDIDLVANYLQNHVKIYKRERVGVLMRSSAQTLATIFGVLKAGGIVVILDIDKTPVNRCDVMLKDSNVRTVFVDRLETELEALWEKDFAFVSRESVVTANYDVEIESTFTRREEAVPELLIDEDIFGLFYTSGTTGVPKGVVVTMANVLNLVNWWQDFFQVSPGDRILLFSSLSFIMSLRQYVPTLCSGATVVIPRTAVDFESAIVDCQVNKLVCTPSALATLDTARMGGITSVQVAGEAPQKSTLEKWNPIVDNFYIGLGPTELCAHAMCGRYDGANICIGHPARNVRSYIVDPRSNLEVPVNVVGELWVAGANVAKGYLNRTEQTLKHFSSDPFRKDGARMYKTGDLARRLPDGRIQFVGRRDMQIKVNGFRIEPGDIINTLPTQVNSAKVVVQEGALVLYVTPEVDKASIISGMEQKLPTYMIPRIVLSLPSFPLNKNKKVDTTALMEMGATFIKEKKKMNRERSETMTSLEKTIRFIWCEILEIGIDDLTVNDNFFERGGTSLSAVIMSRKLSKELEVEVSVQDIFAHQSIKAFAAALAKSNDLSGRSIDPPLAYLPGGRDRLHPLLFGTLQVFGLAIMSFLVMVPILATAFVSTRAFLWYGTKGFFLFPLFLVSGCIVHMTLVAACKWLIVGKYFPGKARLYSWMFLKWWLVRRIIHASRLYTWAFDETVFSRYWFLLLGGKVGKNCHVEEPYILEPDLVTIGNNCKIGFETQFCTSEIKGGCLELRRVSVGDNVRIGVRSVLLGGTNLHDGCEVLPKSMTDFSTSSTCTNQVLGGSPAGVCAETDGNPLKHARGCAFAFCQLFAIFIQIYLMAGIAFVGIEIAIMIQESYGTIPMIAYLGSIFSVMLGVMYLLVIVLLYRMLLRIESDKLYTGAWFEWRKWFLDRMFLSPLFAYASQRILQTSSTFPWYLQLLGARIGKRAWMNHPYIRVGVNLFDIGDDSHMGMLSYFTSEMASTEGMLFSKVKIGNHASFGQRCVVLGGSAFGNNVTVGAETLIPSRFEVPTDGTTFGSPPVLFKSGQSEEKIIEQAQKGAKLILEDRNSANVSTTELDLSTKERNLSSANQTAPARRQDVGKGMFWTYVFVTLCLQALLPTLVGGSYVAIYYGVVALVGELRLEYIVLAVPCIYILGSLLLMLLLKVIQLAGGSFSIGTANFFSWRFFCWHIFADMVYLCTSSVIYPFSGTQFYVSWLRFMGAKVGKNVFVSPENGGFREIDFLDVGDDAVLMTPNIHAHYTDHGMLQFCPVKLENGVVINPGATIMPLTQYAKNSSLGPFSVTLKGQQLESDTRYFGNPCKPEKRRVQEEQQNTILFPGQGTQYPGMLEKYLHLEAVQKMVDTASKVFGFNVVEACSSLASSESMEAAAQPLVFISSLAAAEALKQQHPLDFSRVHHIGGFSLGEITALCYAGALAFEDALQLVKLRSDAMAQCAGAMCNVRGLPREVVDRLCRQRNCSIANFICENHQAPRHNIYVVAGSKTSIKRLVSQVHRMKQNCKELNAEDVGSKELRVSGAFHSKFMLKAQKDKQFNQFLKDVPLTLPSHALVYSNVTGAPHTSAEEIRRLLRRQIVEPVQWQQSIQGMIVDGHVTKFYECGPMDSLSRIGRNIQKAMIDGDDLGATLRDDTSSLLDIDVEIGANKNRAKWISSDRQQARVDSSSLCVDR